mmetsp:Transcript_11745/g.24029  ORF Transcript_11745/g.24029 Transcript_11745/m.24029 type:complete len:240 (-) Transcript_11745:36-755(-)
MVCVFVIARIGGGEDSSLVLVQGTCIDVARDGAASVDFRQEVLLSIHFAILFDGCVREDVYFAAEPSAGREGVASPASVHRGAAPVTMRTKSLAALGTASSVLHASLVRHKARVLDELERSGVRATVTAPSHVRSAVQYELNSKIDVDSLPLPVDLDAVSERRETSVSPTRSTILRDVLVKVAGEEVHAINVPPVEVVRNRLSRHISMRKRGGYGGLDGVIGGHDNLGQVFQGLGTGSE